MVTAKRELKPLAAWVGVMVLGGQALPLQASPSYFPGTRHCYEVIQPATDVDWAYAKALAESLSYVGVGGHMATITSPEENAFVAALLDPQGHYWLGGRQAPSGTEPDGGWEWVSGETWGFSNFSAGAPENFTRQTAVMNLGTPGPDLTGFITGGDGMGNDGHFDIRFGQEPLIGPVVFPHTSQFSLRQIAEMISAASQTSAGYDGAALAYNQDTLNHHLELAARDHGSATVVFHAGGQEQVGLEAADFSCELAEEDVLEMTGSSGCWNDQFQTYPGRGYVVEYPVPEPGGLAMLAGMGIAIPGPWRRKARGAQVSRCGRRREE